MGQLAPQSFEFHSLTGIVRIGFSERVLEPALPTGIATLDRTLPGGGLPVGKLTELYGGRAAGKLSIAFTALAHTLGRGEAAALVDPEATATPDVWACPSLERLLVARGGGVLRALQATRALIETRAFALIVLDLPGKAKLDDGNAGSRTTAPNRSAFVRLARATESAATALLVLSEQLPWRTHGFTSLASLRLEARPGPTGTEVVVIASKHGHEGARAVVGLSRTKVDLADR